MSDLGTPSELPDQVSVAQLRRREREATQSLLGDTIMIGDQDWQEASRLPGWTRAHVATHIARNADALRRSVTGLLNHTSTRMYPSEAEKVADLEAGSLRGALELQIDLDTSAGELSHAFDQLEDVDPDEVVQLAPGQRVSVGQLPLARLNEVVLHHLDLDCGYTAEMVDGDIARWLLEWNCSLIGDSDLFPALEVYSHSGWHARIGGPGRTTTVRGTDARLLCWLTGRAGAELIEGADDVELPTW